MLTDSQLKKIMPNAPQGRRTAALPILNQVAKDYDISNERRMAAWLATLAVESGELKYQEEIASGAAYEGRKDLGNTQKGDGRRFKGSGRIQITGRFNFQAYTNYLKRSGHLPFVDFMSEPARLAQEPYATDAAGWFWAIKIKANAIADRGDFLTTQVRVNGRNKKTGLPNHWSVRNGYFLKALSVLPDDFSFSAPAPSNGDHDIPSVVNQLYSDTLPVDPQLPGLTELPILGVPAAAIEVPQISPMPDTPSDPPKEEPLVKIGNRVSAVWTAIGTTLIAIGTFLTSTPLGIAISIISAVALVGGVYMFINWRRNETKERRDHETKLAKEKQEAELKAERERQAFELQKLTLESAMRRDLNTVTIAAPPAIEMANSDSNEAG